MTPIARPTATAALTPRRRVAVLTAVFTGAAAMLIGLPPTASAAPVTTEFGAGQQATFAVPARVTSVHVELVGGRGGDGSAPGSTGGFGATLGADLDVTPGETLYVLVGDNGGEGQVGGSGGANGGGGGGAQVGGGGGGGSDVRTVPPTADDSLASRLLVAGGGGGAGGVGGAGGSSSENGSDGQRSNCGDGGGPGGGGSPTAGGGAGADSPMGLGGGFQTPGSLGAGGQGDSGSGAGGGGGGGGGYFGGGGGGSGYDCGGGGGGGSSYAGARTHGAGFGTDASGTPRITITYLTPGPEVTTTAASEVTATSATLHGVVNPASKTSTYQFEYGTSTAYGAVTDPPQLAGSGSDPVSATGVLSGLSTGTTYHYRLVATNVNGTTRGVDQSFTTGRTGAAAAPQATTSPASAISQTGATLNGVVDPGGSPTAYVFEYGTTTGYGSTTTRTDAGSGARNVSVDAAVTGLSPGTTYHFRVVATSATNVTDAGADRSFTTAATTAAPAPQATTSPVSDVSDTGATLVGVVAPMGSATTYAFEYGTTAGYGTTTPAKDAGSGMTNVEVTAPVTGMTAGTSYHFRLVATNASGTTRGADRTFTTGTAVRLTVVTLPASSVDKSSAMLNGAVNSGGAATTYRFEYGTSTSYGSSTPAIATGSGGSWLLAQAPLSGLARHTTYHFRVVATNAAGTMSGSDLTFRTS